MWLFLLGVCRGLLFSRKFWLMFGVLLTIFGAYRWAYDRGYQEREQEDRKDIQTKALRIAELNQQVFELGAEIVQIKDNLNKQVQAQQEQSKAVVAHLQERIQHWQDQAQKIKEASNVNLVTPKADSQCRLTAGFEWMLNVPTFDTAEQLAASAPRDVDAAASSSASEVAESVNANYRGCRDNEHQLDLWLDWYSKWQSWLKDNAKAFDKPK